MTTLWRTKLKLRRPKQGKKKANGSVFASLAQQQLHSFEEQAQRFEEVYTVEEEPLGEGSFGKVYKAFRKDSEHTKFSIPYAVKEIRKSNLKEKDKLLLQDEVNALAKLHHPNIIGFFERFDTPDYVNIVMEYVTGGTLYDMLKKEIGYSEVYVKKYIYQIASALKYCKKMGVVHRDIKPANVLVTGDIHSNPMIKLIDFGFSAIVDLKVNSIEDKNLNAWVGTIFYASPEIIDKFVYNFKTDFWSLGVLMFELLSAGHKPFTFDHRKRGSNNAMMSRISKGEFEFAPEHVWRSVSAEAKDLINKMLTVDPDARYGAEETLNHVWLEEENRHKCSQETMRRRRDTLFSSGKTGAASTSNMLLRSQTFGSEALGGGHQETMIEEDIPMKKMREAVSLIRCAAKLRSFMDEPLGSTEMKRKSEVKLPTSGRLVDNKGQFTNETSQNFGSLNL